MAYATAADVAVELGRPASSAEEGDQWDAWIARVERSIVRAFRRAGYTLDAQVALGEPTADDVQDVEVAAVIRKIQNPTHGETSYTRSVDDTSITTRREGADTSDPLALTDAEWASLFPIVAKPSRAFSILPS